MTAVNQVVDVNSIAAPIYITTTQEVREFRGTGFVPLTNGRSFVVTARHVIPEQIEADEHLVAQFKTGDGAPMTIRLPMTNLVQSSRYDLAAVEVAPSTAASVTRLPLLGARIGLHHDVTCQEYSSSELIRDRDTGRRQFNIRGRFHKGNITCHYEDTLLSTVPAPHFEVSFPALQGASGAPVLLNGSCAGVLLANRETHLGPAQVVVARDTNGEPIETISYFLPVGLCLSSECVLDFMVNEVGAEVVLPTA